MKSLPVAVGGEAGPTAAAAPTVAFEADDADRGDCVNTFVDVLDDGAAAGAADAADAAAAFEADDCGEGV